MILVHYIKKTSVQFGSESKRFGSTTYCTPSMEMRGTSDRRSTYFFLRFRFEYLNRTGGGCRQLFLIHRLLLLLFSPLLRLRLLGFLCRRLVCRPRSCPRYNTLPGRRRQWGAVTGGVCGILAERALRQELGGQLDVGVIPENRKI